MSTHGHNKTPLSGEELALLYDLETESCRPSPYFKEYIPPPEAADKRRHEALDETRERIKKMMKLAQMRKPNG